MLNKEDILALAWEHSEGSGKRYTFTEENLFEFLKELKKEPAPAQDEREAFEQWADQQWPGAQRGQLERDEYGRYKSSIYRDFWTGWQARANRPAQTEQQHFSGLLDLIEKMTVSVDVSTGEHDTFNRLFCKVAEVQQEGDGSWTILAVDPEPNFAPIAQTAPDSDMRDNYLDLLQEVLDAKEVMRAAGIEQGSFGVMFKQLAKQTAPQPEQSERKAFEARMVLEGGPGAVDLWISGNPDAGYSNERVNDYRFGWVACLEWVKGQQGNKN